MVRLMGNRVTVQIDRDEMAIRIINAVIAPNVIYRLGTATETINCFSEEAARSARAAADAALMYVFDCLMFIPEGQTKH